MFLKHCLWHSGAYEWAQKTLRDHAKDKRQYLYTREQLETAKTHDKLWNGAQVHITTEMLLNGLCFALILTSFYCITPLVSDDR